MTISFVPSWVVVMASTGPSVVGAQAELKAPVAGFTEAALGRGSVNAPPR